MRPLWRTFLSGQLSTGRLVGLGALGALAVVLGLAIGAADGARPLDDGVVLISSYGLSLFVPVTALVFASAALGEPNEDATLVYLWLRPVPRWKLVVAAAAAALTIALPAVVVPLAVAALVTGAGGSLVAATVASCTLATVAYVGVFTWLGLRVRRALLWGLLYVLVWEGFVARVGGTASLLAIRTHATSLLARLTGTAGDLVEVSLATSLLVPVTATVAGLALATRRLQRQDVA
ncbi:MAG: hypothetical protein KY450_07485 [Actinobacteria bacterium]|nr:hypothetical protein [Actinomycetota bacterium]